MAASLRELMVATFNGAPTPEAVTRYSAQLNALISLYICFVAVFLIGLYAGAVEAREGLSSERRSFKVWIAYALILSLLLIAAYLEPLAKLRRRDEFSA